MSGSSFINFVDPTGRASAASHAGKGGLSENFSGLTPGEFFGAVTTGAVEGFNSPAGKFFTGAGIMIATGGSSSVVILTTDLTAGTWKSLEGSAGMMAQATGQYDQFSESISLMPDSIPKVVGGLTGAAIDQSNGGDGMAGFEQGSQIASVAESLVTLPISVANAGNALDVALIVQNIAGTAQGVLLGTGKKVLTRDAPRGRTHPHERATLRSAHRTLCLA